MQFLTYNRCSRTCTASAADVIVGTRGSSRFRSQVNCAVMRVERLVTDGFSKRGLGMISRTGKVLTRTAG
jgi:hypothetical protein